MTNCFDKEKLSKRSLPLQFSEFLNENNMKQIGNVEMSEIKIEWIPEETDFEGYKEGKEIYAVFWPGISNSYKLDELKDKLKIATSGECKSYLQDGNTQEAFQVKRKKQIQSHNIEIPYRDKSDKELFMKNNEQGIVVKEHWKSFENRQKFMNECFAKAGLSGKGLPMKYTSNKYGYEWLNKKTVNLVFSELNENAKIKLNENAIKQGPIIKGPSRILSPRSKIAG